MVVRHMYIQYASKKTFTCILVATVYMYMYIQYVVSEVELVGGATGRRSGMMVWRKVELVGGATRRRSGMMVWREVKLVGI